MAEGRMTWEYVAGFFDGEGCLTASQRRTGAVWQVVQKTNAVLVAIQTFFVAHGIESSLKRNLSHPARMYSLQVSRRASLTLLLTQLRPLVIVKKQPVEDALRFLKLYPEMGPHIIANLTWESRRTNQAARAARSA